MRRYIFGWMAVALVVASAAGCGGNGGDSSNYLVPDISPVSDSQKISEYEVSNFQKGDNCYLVISSNAKTADSRDLRKVTISTDVDYSQDSDKRVLAKDGEEEDTKAYAPIACGFAEAAQDITTVNETEKATARLDAEPSARHLDEENGVDDLWAAFDGTASSLRVKNVHQGAYCNILSSTTFENNKNYKADLTEAQAKQVAELFDGFEYTKGMTSYNGSNGIYRKVTDFCGSEWTPGRDDSSRVNIVFLRDEFMKKQDGGSIYGFVSVRDLLPPIADEKDPKVAKNYSNSGEFIYLNYELFFGGGEGNLTTEDLKSALAHELAHLTQINQKVAKNGQNILNLTPNSSVAELYKAVGEPVLTEGLAEFAAELCDSGVKYAVGGKGASKISLDPICRYMNKKSLFATDENQQSAPTVYPAAFFDKEAVDVAGMGHLFALHVWRYYGENKFKDLYSSPKYGVELLKEVLDEPVEDIMHRYDMALALSGLGELDSVPGDYDKKYSKYQIPYIKLGGSNSYVEVETAGEGEITTIKPIDIKIKKAVDVPYRAVGPKLPQTFEVLPWLNCLTHLQCSASAPLSVKATTPKKAQLNLIHIDTNGDIKNIY